jgi:preprotein translocase subunit SecG
MRRAALLLIQTAISFALLAPIALAVEDHGEGLYGETDDKVVTNAGFILIVFFPLLILLLSLLQSRLEKRKDARKKAAKLRAARSDWHGGW